MYFKESGRTEKGISFPCAALAGNYPHPKPPPARKSPEFAAFSAFLFFFSVFSGGNFAATRGCSPPGTRGGTIA